MPPFTFGRSARAPQSLAASPRELARRWLPAALGLAALAGLLAAALTIAAGAADARSWLVPSSRGGFPGWLAGPLPDVAEPPTPEQFGALMLLMCACYAAALACWRAVAPRVWIGGLFVLHAIVALAPPLLSTDSFNYLAWARLDAVHGLDPYANGSAAAPGDPVFPFVGWHHVPTPYGPLFTLATAALSPLGVPAALWTLKAVTALAAGACLALVWRCADALGRDPLPATLLVGLNPVWLVWAVGGAHNDVLMVLGLLAAIALVVRGRERAGAGALVIAAAVKASAVIVAPFLLLGARRPARALASVAAVGVLVGAVALAVFGHADALGLAGLRGSSVSSSYYSFPSELGRWLGLGGATGALRASAQAAGVVAVAAMLVRVRRGATDWITGAGWSTLAVLLGTAWLLPWYEAWLLPLAALGRSRALRLATLALTLALVLVRVPVWDRVSAR